MSQSQQTYITIANEHRTFASRAPSVTIPWWDWALLSICLGLTALMWSGLTTPSSLLTALLLAINVLLLASTTLRALRSGTPGLALLVLACIIFFWFDVFVLASQTNPFAPPAGMPANEDCFSSQEVSTALCHCAVFEAMIFVGYSCLKTRNLSVRQWMASRVDANTPFAKILPFVLIPFGYTSLAIGYDFKPDAILSALVSGRLGVTGAGEQGLVVSLDHFGMFAAAFFFLRTTSGGKLKRLTNILLGTLAATPFLFSGTRHYLLYIFLPLCIAGFRSISGSANSKHLIKWTVLFITLSSFSLLQVTLRSVGWHQILSPQEIQITPDASGQFSCLLYAEQIVPADHQFFHEFAEPFFITHWIPRQYWPGKPVMAAWEYYNASYTHGRKFNVTPSIIGQYYMNWGVIGVIGAGLWLGLLVRLVDSVTPYIQSDRQTAAKVVIGMSYAFLVASFRFYNPVYFTYLAFAVIAMLFVTTRASRRSSKTGAVAEAGHQKHLRLVRLSSQG